MKGHGRKFQKGVSSKFLAKYGKMLDKNGEVTTAPIVSFIPVPVRPSIYWNFKVKAAKPVVEVSGGE